MDSSAEAMKLDLSDVPDTIRKISSLNIILNKELEENQLILNNAKEQLMKETAKDSDFRNELALIVRKRINLEFKRRNADIEYQDLQNEILTLTKRSQNYEKIINIREEEAVKQQKKLLVQRQKIKDRETAFSNNESINQLEALKLQLRDKKEEKAKLECQLADLNLNSDVVKIEFDDEMEDDSKIKILEQISDLRSQVTKKREETAKIEKGNLILQKKNKAQLLRLKRQIQDINSGPL